MEEKRRREGERERISKDKDTERKKLSWKAD